MSKPHQPQSTHIPARSAACVQVDRGAQLRIVDVEGGQVADVWACARATPAEVLSNGDTFDCCGTLHLTTGDALYSNRGQAMLTIVEDEVGRHDFLFAPCNTAMFARQYGITESHPTCRDNLAAVMSSYGVDADRIATPFNAFMNVEHLSNGRLEVRAPKSRAGDALTLRAEMDLVVGISACAASLCSGGVCTSIRVELIPGTDS